MKAFQVIMSLLLLAALLIPAYAALQGLKEKKAQETPLPLEDFRAFLQNFKGVPVELLAWSKPGDSCEVYVKRIYTNTGRAVGAPESFVKLQTKNGSAWFYNNLGEFVPIAGYLKAQ